jgi:hypothetical protein
MRARQLRQLEEEEEMLKEEEEDEEKLIPEEEEESSEWETDSDEDDFRNAQLLKPVFVPKFVTALMYIVVFGCFI